MKLLVISGSLRKASCNTALAKLVVASAKKQGATAELFPIDKIPLYNDDLLPAGFPAPVRKLRDAIRAADALFLCTPEYNYSVSGVLKNALDWISRPEFMGNKAKPDDRSCPFGQKVIAMAGASGSGFGTVRAQLHLRQILQQFDPVVIPEPELHVSRCFEAFDEKGQLKDEKQRQTLDRLVARAIETAGKR